VCVRELENAKVSPSGCERLAAGLVYRFILFRINLGHLKFKKWSYG
jgi:hypothetical protein